MIPLLPHKANPAKRAEQVNHIALLGMQEMSVMYAAFFAGATNIVLQFASLTHQIGKRLGAGRSYGERS